MTLELFPPIGGSSGNAGTVQTFTKSGINAVDWVPSNANVNVADNLVNLKDDPGDSGLFGSSVNLSPTGVGGGSIYTIQQKYPYTNGSVFRKVVVKLGTATVARRLTRIKATLGAFPTNPQQGVYPTGAYPALNFELWVGGVLKTTQTMPAGTDCSRFHRWTQVLTDSGDGVNYYVSYSPKAGTNPIVDFDIRALGIVAQAGDAVELVVTCADLNNSGKYLGLCSENYLAEYMSYRNMYTRGNAGGEDQEVISTGNDDGNHYFRAYTSVAVAETGLDGQASRSITVYNLKKWNSLTFTKSTPAGTTNTIDLLDGAGNVLASDITSPYDMSAITAKTVKVRETLSRPNTSTTTPNLTAFSISWDEGISAPTGFEGKKPVSAFARSGTVIDIQNGSGVAVVMLRTNTGGASNMTAKITVDGTILVNSPLTLQASQAVVYGGFSAMFGAGGTDPIMSNGWGQVESGGLQAIPWIGFSKSLKVELTNSVNYGGNGCFVGVLI